MEQREIETLGERIVKAARMAVAMHMYQAVDLDGQHGRATDEQGMQSHTMQARLGGGTFRQRVVIGGTGPRVVDDVDGTINDADLRHG